MSALRQTLEHRQLTIYFAAISAGALAALTVPGTQSLETVINPALALMLFVTFLQVPLSDLGRAFARVRFFAALLLTNFVVLPVLVGGLIYLLPADPMLRLGVLLVLLTPCIDYVVTFSHLGQADGKVLLASTPALLIAQMALLPVYLKGFLGDDAARYVQVGPFVHAFVWLIVIPLMLSAAVQVWSRRSQAGRRTADGLGVLPVPMTALVLFVVVAAVVPQLGPALGDALRVIPAYTAFALIAPLLGWGFGRLFHLDAPAGRALAFSAATRNSLVVLPLAFAVPGGVPLLPAVVVTQTLVELVSEMLYVRLLPKLGAPKPVPVRPA
ncbi:arsenic resistance protein [Enterovirga sp. CN4-39]|uniref:arsenic resistance protein n=1 Tax=Enterovirga sp. CN4-39 TaxID=3400910 RepID=UPI003C06208D